MLPGLRRRLRAWLARQGFEAAASADVVLAVSEALNNAIEHAYREVDGTVRLRVAAEGNLLRSRSPIAGSGSSRSRTTSAGRGILLMNSLMDSVEIESNGAGTTVTLERRGRAQTPTESQATPSA